MRAFTHIYRALVAATCATGTAALVTALIPTLPFFDFMS